MTVQTNKRCLFILSEKEKYGIHEIIKPLKPIYNGIGWYVDDRYEDEVKKFSQNTNMKVFEFPLLEETFEDLRLRHKISYFKEKDVKIQLQINNIKSELQISGLENSEITSDQYKDALYLSSRGKHLIELIDEQKRLQEQIKSIEIEENIAKTNLHTFHYLLKPMTLLHISEELKQTSSGVPVGFKIGEIDLKIPGGALTVLAAPTSHGKTTVAVNFCLGALSQKENQNKSIYFFSYEESRAAITSIFLNVFMDIQLSKNNREAIQSYLRDFSIDHVSNKSKQDFLKKINDFTKFLENGLLNIFYTEMNAKELVTAIQFLKMKTNVGIVCIDYIQLLKLGDGRFGSRQEELKEICLILKNCAVETGIPIILGAQFNRTVLAEADLWPTNIGEAGDIERIANTIIGFWNRNFDGSRDGNRDKNGKQIKKESTIYFEILKSRQFGSGHKTILSFNSNSGKLNSQLSDSNPVNSLFG